MKYRLILSLLFISLISCDNNSESVIPSYKVNLELNLNFYPSLKVEGGYQIITQKPNSSSYIGYGGVLVLKSFSGEYFSFDIACPYENNPNIKLSIIDNHKAVCSKCESEYNGIFWGNRAPSAGPATQKSLTLRNYSTFFSSDKLQIIN